jgi:multiple sugar transport system ATP-binding protein
MGIRPEDIHDPSYSPPGIEAAAVEAQVDVTELLGNEVLMYLKSGNLSYIARVDPRTSARIGQNISVLLNTSNMHLFDAETEQAIR